MHLLIKLSPDITLKSDYVRKSLIRRLDQNIHAQLKTFLEKGDYILDKKYDRLELQLKNSSDEKKTMVIESLQFISGIAFFWERESFSRGSFEEILAEIVPRLSFLKNKSFRVSVKRRGIHGFTSNDLARFLGGGILRRIENTSVQMKNFDYNVQIEVKDDIVSLLTTRHEGVGGMPMGAEERIVSLISGGFDSGVSSFLMMRKGAPTDFLFFNLGGYDHREGVKQVSKYLAEKCSAGYNPNMIVVPFEKVMQELIENIEQRYRTIVLKRCMMRAAEILCKDFRYAAIVTGESIAQVSSQTIINLSVIEKSLEEIPLFRPLLTYNKNEIIKISRDLGTDIFAAQMPEFCGVISKNPATCAKLEAVLETEKNLSDDLIENAVANKTVEKISEMQLMKEGEIPLASIIEKDDIIIDLRQPQEVTSNQNPFEEIAKNKVLEIPFYEINEKFKNLDASKTYIFFCSKGIMSKSHAQDLYQAGFTNIKIFKKGIGCKK